MFLNFQNKFQKNSPKENKDTVNSLKILLIKVHRTNQHGSHDNTKTVQYFSHIDSLRHYECPRSNQIALF